MPELVEVEMMCQKLENYSLSNFKVEHVVVHRGKYFQDGVHDLIGKRFQFVRRRGKYMLFVMREGGTIICHNAMSGYWDLESKPWTFDYVEGKRTAGTSDVRVSIGLVTPAGTIADTLRFHDTRLFGRLHYDPSMNNVTEFERTVKLGPEPIWTEQGVMSEWYLTDFRHDCKSSTKSIKELLTNQKVIAGIGNIYAAEILWKAKVRPDRLSCDLKDEEIYMIREMTLVMFDMMIRHTRERDFRVNYDLLKVYRKKNCYTCKTSIQNVKLDGRSSYFCPQCQK